MSLKKVKCALGWIELSSLRCVCRTEWSPLPTFTPGLEAPAPDLVCLQVPRNQLPVGGRHGRRDTPRSRSRGELPVERHGGLRDKPQWTHTGRSHRAPHYERRNVGTTAQACRAAVLTSCSTSSRHICHGPEHLSVDQAGGCCSQRHYTVLPSTRAAHPVSPVLHSPHQVCPATDEVCGVCPATDEVCGSGRPPIPPAIPSRSRPAAPIDIDE